MSDIFQSLWYTIYSSLIASIIRLRWHRLWVRENEFHSSLSTDDAVITHLEQSTRFTRWLFGCSSRTEYETDLLARRQVNIATQPTRFYSRINIWLYYSRHIRNSLSLNIPQLAFLRFFLEARNIYKEYQISMSRWYARTRTRSS